MPELFSFQDINYTFANTHRYIRESGYIMPASLLVLQGASGAGKSTLLKILARLIKADSGTVFLQGKDWTTYAANEWRLNVQYVSQQPVIFAGTVEENLLLPYKIKTVASARKEPDLVTMEKYLSALGLDKKVLSQTAKTLSGGERARIAIIRALLIEPLLLLLDEPSAYLDSESREKTMLFLNQWLENSQGGIIMVSHNHEDLDYLENYQLLNMVSWGANDG